MRTESEINTYIELRYVFPCTCEEHFRQFTNEILDKLLNCYPTGLFNVQRRQNRNFKIFEANAIRNVARGYSKEEFDIILKRILIEDYESRQRA